MPPPNLFWQILAAALDLATGVYPTLDNAKAGARLRLLLSKWTFPTRVSIDLLTAANSSANQAPHHGARKDEQEISARMVAMFAVALLPDTLSQST